MASITHSTASNMNIDISANFPLMLSSLGMRTSPIDMSQKTPEGRKPECFIVKGNLLAICTKEDTITVF